MTTTPDPNPDHPAHRAFAVLELADHIVFQHELKLMIEFGNATRELIDEPDHGWWRQIDCCQTCRELLKCPCCDSVANAAYGWDGYDTEVEHSPAVHTCDGCRQENTSLILFVTVAESPTPCWVPPLLNNPIKQ
jgi:hypothetical protein